MTFALLIGCGVGFVVLFVAAGYELVTAPLRDDFERHVDEALAMVDEPRPERIGELRVLVADELAQRRDRGAQS